MKNQAFWSSYQPGFRFARHSVGSREFFDEVTAYRYEIEPHVPDVVDFPRWAGCDVLEAGCGIGTDGARFAAHGARYTGLDFSPTALDLARRRFRLDGLPGQFAEGSVTALPFADESFDLVFSHGVIHHVADTEDAVAEFYRVLKPGGTALVMVYNRRSFNYHVTIMGVRRAFVALLSIPRATKVVASITHEPEDVLAGHAELLASHGRRYITDRALFLSHNTDGPGNALTKVYSAAEMSEMLSFAGFDTLTTDVRYLNLRLYPGGLRFSETRAGRRLAARLGWHLYVRGQKTALVPVPA